MKILALSPYLPYPLNCGGHLRSHHTLAALVDDHEVTFVAQVKDPQQSYEGWSLATRFARPPLLVPRGTDPSHASDPMCVRLRAAAPHPRIGVPRGISGHDFDTYWAALASLPLGSYDAVMVRTFHLMPYALAIQALHPHLLLVLDLDDVQSVYQRRALASANLRWLSRWRMRVYLDLVRIRYFERHYLRQFDAVWICSELDRQRVAAWTEPEKVFTVPNGVELSALEAIVPNPDSMKLLFVGDFRQEPNQRGILAFAEQVMPRIRRAVPTVELWVAGRDPSPEVAALHRPDQRVFVTGFVPSMVPYLEDAAISIVPLQVGSGTRLKILEAMAAAVPVVSTRVGAEGIDLVDGESGVLADGADAMASACVRLLQDKSRRQRMGLAGRRLARAYDWAIAAQVVRGCYAGLRPSRAADGVPVDGLPAAGPRR